jgi:hypothetical protein
MFLATGQLALRVTGTSWHVYLGVQIGALVIAVITCGVALSLRLLLEAWQASSPTITLGVLAGAAVPWSAGMLWILGEPDCEPLRARLPASWARLVDTLHEWVSVPVPPSPRATPPPD